MPLTGVINYVFCIYFNKHDDDDDFNITLITRVHMWNVLITSCRSYWNKNMKQAVPTTQLFEQSTTLLTTVENNK